MIKKNQQGATLIIVLMLLLAITIIGTLAVRQGLVSLNIATNSQAVQLMTQSSDAAIFRVEDSTNLARSLARDGMFGFIKAANYKGKELVFCFRGTQSQFFDLTQASLVYLNDAGTGVIDNAMGTLGYCQTSSTNENFFTSNRRAVMTQVSVSFVADAAGSQPFEGGVRGTDDDVPIEKTEKVVVHAISLMPTISTATTQNIDDCLRLLSNTNNANLSVTRCLANQNVPFTTHVTEYSLGQDFKEEAGA